MKTLLGDSDEDYGRSIAVDAGHIYVAGYRSKLWGGPKLKGKPGGFVVRINKSGKKKTEFFARAVVLSMVQDMTFMYIAGTVGAKRVKEWVKKRWKNLKTAHAGALDGFAAKIEKLP